MRLKFFGPKYQNWSNKSFGVCAISGVLTLYGAEKKVRAVITKLFSDWRCATKLETAALQ